MAYRDRWMFSLLAITGGLVGGILSPRIFQPSVIAGQIPHELVAEKFVVQDKDGNRLAILAADGIGLVDRKGNVRVNFGVLSDGTPALVFYDEKGHMRASLAAFPDKTILEFDDANDRPQSTLLVTPGGTNALRFFDRDGKVQGVLGVNKGHAALVLGHLVVTDKGHAGFAHSQAKEGGNE